MFIAPLLAEAGGSLLDSARETGLQFGVNWPLFLSNAVSFLVVCVLLNRFAYRPILDVLEARRQRIAESLENADKIKQQLADAEARHAEILDRANEEARKMIDEARTAAAALSEKRQQQAIAEAEQIIAKAREALEVERDRAFSDLRREVGRLVVETTAKVTGKVLNDEDRRRLSEEANRDLAA